MAEALGTLALFLFICGVPAVLVAGGVGWVVYRNRKRIDGSKLIGEALGLGPTVKAKQMQWYEGKLANGRSCAYIPIVFPRRTEYSDGRPRTSYDSAVRIIVEVKRGSPMDVNVMRHQKWTEKRRPFNLFEDAFNAENGSKLTSTEQNALMAFAKEHPGTVWLSDREEASRAVFNDDSIMSEVTSFLLHEYRAKNPTPDEIGELVAKLSRLAAMFDEDYI